MADEIIARGEDGLFHPSDEQQIIDLIAYARRHNRTVRARGATHSVAWSIYSDPVAGAPTNKTLEQTPPIGDDVNIAFDEMRELEWIDEDQGIVEVEPGINLGFDPRDPFGISTLENSFLYQIFEKGWAVDVLGGITHQTAAGFTATGSAGGSTRYGWNNVIAFRVVDGMGNAEWIDKEHADFPAFSVSMGLLGIITRIRFQLVPIYNIKGTESTTPIAGPSAPVDLFGPGDADRPSLEQYLKQTPYTRIVWWPQKGAERIQTWRAERVEFTREDLEPYEQFPPTLGGQTEQLLGSTVFILLGNTNMFRELRLIAQNIPHYLTNLSNAANGSGQRIFYILAGTLVAAITLLIGLFFSVFQGLARVMFATLLKLFQPITKPGRETQFHDFYWRSLCMDNTVDDVFLGTEFTEIWVPIGEAQRTMNLYREMFEAGGAAATGYFSTEVYAGPPSSAWMHPGYSDGADAYRDGTVRFDVYWFRANKGAPNVDEGFFEQYWDLLKDNGVPFRLHWGKFIPRFDFGKWAAHYRENLPRFDDFLTVRERRDPDGIFFNRYWRERLTGSA